MCLLLVLSVSQPREYDPGWVRIHSQCRDSVLRSFLFFGVLREQPSGTPWGIWWKGHQRDFCLLELHVVSLRPGVCGGHYEAEKAGDSVWGCHLLCGCLLTLPHAGSSAA